MHVKRTCLNGWQRNFASENQLTVDRARECTCLAVSGSVVNSRAEVQFELSIGSTVGAE